MKKISKIVIMSFIMVLMFLITSCNEKTFDVSYYIDNTLITTLKVEEGKEVELSIYKIYIEEKNSYMSEYISTIKGENKEFEGWYDNNQYNTKVESLTINSNVELYGRLKEKAKKYQVTLNENGGTIVSDLTVLENTVLEKDSLPTITKEGYTFGGWYLDAGCVAKFISLTVKSNLTLHAKWNVNTYKVSFNTDGGNEIDEISVKYNESFELPQNPTKEGYKFGGWYTDKKLTKEYNQTKVTSNVTLYAKWEELLKYNVIFNTNGGTEVENIIVKENETVDLSNVVTVKNNYNFIGWYIDSSLQTLFDEETAINSNITLYAKWQEKTKYTISFDTNGGSTLNPLTIYKGEKIEVLDEPLKDDHTFGGWYIDSSLTTPFDYNATITKSMTLYAKWNEVIKYNDFSVHFMQLDNYNSGDCVYIKAGDVDILIDAGSRDTSLTSNTNYINKYCKDGILEYVIVTHAHQDHIACFGSSNGIFAKYEVETIIDFPKTNSTSQVYERYLTAREAEIEAGAKHYDAYQCIKGLAGAQKVYQITKDISFEILEQKYYYTNTNNENDYSVCVMFKSVNNYFLFTGDLEKAGEESLVALNKLPQVELYKSGHHGSSTSSNEVLLSKIKPKAVVVTCCAGTDEYTKNTDNQFPTQEFINRVARYTDKIYIPSVATYTISTSSGSEYLDTTGFKALNGDVVVSSISGVISVKCSNNDIILKNSEWFNKVITLNGVTRPMRVWPSYGV